MFRFLRRLVAFALAACAVVFLLPAVSGLRILPFSTRVNVVAVTELIKREMRLVGKLVVVEYKDESVLHASVDARILGTVQQVTVPYAYEAALGIDLEEVRVETDGGDVLLNVPRPTLLYDKLTPGEATIQDFWFPLSKERYQALLTEEEARCREAYLQDDAKIEAAWGEAIDRLNGLIAKWMADAGQPEGAIIFAFDRVDQTATPSPSQPDTQA